LLALETYMPVNPCLGAASDQRGHRKESVVIDIEN